MKKTLIALILSIAFLAGCDGVRFAPGETQKQNAWLHNRTAQLAADMAGAQEASRQLRDLTALSESQSKAFVSYYGMPKEFPLADSTEQILAESSWALSESAISQSAQRPDVWDITDGAIDLGIAMAALFGGIYGVRAGRFLKQARTKSKALREIIDGNEIFKRQHSELAESFKSAQKVQSPQTRQLVSQIKNS